jgi:predicted GNAT superfamily acetyltransferase
MPPLRAIAPADLPALLALNNAHAVELSEATAEGFTGLVAHAALALVTGAPAAPDAFLLAFDHTTPPQGPNHSWFLARHRLFLYVDRVCVAPHARGRGLARALYAAVVDAASARGLPVVCCEVNSDPPNPASDALHASLGFSEVGRRRLLDRGKSVRYLERSVLQSESTTLVERDGA